jgi:hypothetical protein
MIFSLLQPSSLTPEALPRTVDLLAGNLSDITLGERSLLDDYAALRSSSEPAASRNGVECQPVKAARFLRRKGTLLIREAQTRRKLMRKLQVICLAMVMAFVVVPAFAAAPSNSPVAHCPEEHAIVASVLHDFLTPATSSGTNAFGDYFYGYCSQDCTPCYSGNPYPQCAPDIFDGTRQYCLPFRGC